MNSPEEFVSVLAGLCSQIVTTVVTRRVDGDGLEEHGSRAMSISLALFAKWSGQLTSLLERLGNYKTIVYHVADTLHCVLPPGAVMYLNYLQPGTVPNQPGGYCFDVIGMNMADKKLYDTLIDGWWVVPKPF